MQTSTLTIANPPEQSGEKRLFELLAFFVVGVAAFLTIFIEIAAPVNWKQTDITPTVIGLREVVQRQNPYTRELTSYIQRLAFEDVPGITGEELKQIEQKFRQPFNYPLPQALLWVPLAVPFPHALSVALMRFATLAGWFGAVLCLCMAFNSGKSYASYAKTGATGLTVLLLFSAMGSGVTLRTLWPIIQPVGIATLYLGLFTVLYIRRQYAWAGALACIMLYKPQVTSVLFLGVALFAVINPVARWRMLKGFLIATLALSIPAFILIPAWPFDWLKILGWLSNNDETTHIEYVAALGWFGYIVVGLVVVLNIWVWWRAARVSENDPDRTFYLGLALSVGVMSSLFLLPRTGSYDHIANFLPLTFCWSYIALRWKGTARKITIGLGWLVLFVSSITYLFVQGNEIFAVTLALSAFYLGWVAYDFFRKPAPAAGN